MKPLRRLEILLFVVAAVALGAYSYFWAERTVFQWQESRSLDHLLAEGRDGAASDGSGFLVGRIEIPRLDLSAMIVEGVDGRALQLGVGHIPGTALPGEPGNVGLAGHRDTFFRPLRQIRQGDEIRLTSPEGTSDYVVQSTAIVGPRQTQALKTGTGPSLTLVTCYPFDFIGAAPNRFIVEAKKMEAGEPVIPRPSPAVVRKPLRRAPKTANARIVKASEEAVVKQPEDAESAGPPPTGIRPKRKVLRTLSFPLRKTFGWVKTR